MQADVAVLGAGIVGVSVALHLVKRGRSVVLIDRGEAGSGTSFGNAGLIQREGVAPYGFPRSLPRLLRYSLNRSTDMRFNWGALPGLAPALMRYWWASRPSSYAGIVADYSQLIAHSISEHAPLIAEAGAEGLIGKAGWMEVYRSKATLSVAVAGAEDHRGFGLDYRALDPGALAAAEPALAPRFAGAIHWTQPWSVNDPFALTQAYLRLFQSLNGRFVTGDAMTLRSESAGWSVQSDAGQVLVRQAVIAMGARSAAVLRGLGRRLPLFAKRGYHAHYRQRGNASLSMPVYDEAGYVIAPMAAGLRLTTGAEFTRDDAPPNPVQVDACEALARDAFPIADRLPGPAWMGSRPCTPDMKPIIGPAHRPGLFVATGHAHHGLTLGPATGRLLAEMMTGETPFLDPTPYRMERFR